MSQRGNSVFVRGFADEIWCNPVFFEETACVLAKTGVAAVSMTEDEKKTFQEFSFDNEGIRNAVDWLNRFYGENYGTDEEKADTEKRQL